MFKPGNSKIGGEGGGLFVSLKDGESAKLVIRGEILEYRNHWLGKAGSAMCEGEGCPHCKSGNKSTFRFRANVAVLDQKTGAMEAKILEQGSVVYEAFATLGADYPLTQAWMRLTRKGEGLDTEYTVTPLPKWELTKQEQAQVDNLETHDLTPKGKKKDDAPPAKGDDPGPQDDDIPF